MEYHSNYLPSGNQYYRKQRKEKQARKFDRQKHIAIKPDSGYVRNANQPISNDHRTFRSPCKHINTMHFTIHTCLNGKAPGIDNVYNIILKKAIGTGFCKLFARAFTISLKLGFIAYVWKVAILCMLIKPDKPPSQTTSY